jgi:signal transduction histidine kinase
MGWALLKRLLDSVQEAEGLNRSLEARVEEKHRELEQNYSRLNDIERQTAVAGERARMMQDMHDGLGSQLMTTLALVENRSLTQQEVAEALRGCIDDMRLTIDSLQPDDNDLASLLGNLRYRLEPRLKAAGIDLEWKVGELSPLAGAGPHALLQVLRIMQEAFTNVLKHSGATRVRVETRETRTEARLIVADNGTCGDRSQPSIRNGAAGPRRGRGLSNMQSRAQTLGARIERDHHEEGHSVELVFDLTERTPAA